MINLRQGRGGETREKQNIKEIKREKRKTRNHIYITETNG